MTQIVQRTSPDSQGLATLVDNTTVTLETAYSSLDEPAFLFEYEAKGSFLALDSVNDLGGGAGVSICLIRADLIDADLETELTPAQITKTLQGSGRYLQHQRLFAVAKMVPHGDSGSSGLWSWHLHFAPRKKGGIPLNEGNGWKLVVINRSGSNMTTGSIVILDEVRTRFAWGGF